MIKSEQVKEILSEIKTNGSNLNLINSIDEIILSENKNYNTFSKLIYDIFLEILSEYKTTNYSFSTYKSWFITYDNLDLTWDGRDEYLFLWDITDGNKKTLKVIEANKINYKIITEFKELIKTNKVITT